MTTNRIGAIIAAHKKSGRGGIVSVCSAHPAVIRAAAELAREYKATLLLESTSNQVDQFGGYTGLTPAEYIAQTRAMLPADCDVTFGGDHLGPNRWQHLPAAEAMTNSEELIRHYIKAGYEKIHLDCSKYGKRSFRTFFHFDRITAIISESGVPELYKQHFRQHDIRLIEVNDNDQDKK